MITTTIAQWIDGLDGVEYALTLAIAWIAVLTIIIAAEYGRRK